MQNSWDILEQRLIELKTAIQKSDHAKQDALLQETGQLLRNLRVEDKQAIAPEHIQRILKAYQQSQLMLATHHQQAAEQLQRVRKGKRTVQAYVKHS